MKNHIVSSVRPNANFTETQCKAQAYKSAVSIVHSMLTLKYETLQRSTTPLKSVQVDCA
jgi:hypothetical protein